VIHPPAFFRLPNWVKWVGPPGRKREEKHEGIGMEVKGEGIKGREGERRRKVKGS